MARPTNTSIFLRALRENGGKAGNGPLRRILGWNEDKYWTAHQELVDAGLVARGRGQGGSVILVIPETVEDARQSAAILPKHDKKSVAEELVEAANLLVNQGIREIDLYRPACDQLKSFWGHTKKLLHGVYEITAAQGRRETGGSWSRPDIVAVGLRKFEYLPDKVLEVYTFELKAQYDVSIKGVLEALAHREQSTRAYVIYHTGGQAWDDFAEAPRIEQLAARHGIGIIIASDINNFRECWDERVIATRSGSDPEIIDRFIRVTLREESRSEIRKWL